MDCVIILGLRALSQQAFHTAVSSSLTPGLKEVKREVAVKMFLRPQSPSKNTQLVLTGKTSKVSCINDPLNYSSSLGSFGICSHTFLQAAEMPVTFSSVKVMLYIIVGMCICTYVSLLVPVPCSSDLLMPDHQVRTVLLLRIIES